MPLLSMYGSKEALKTLKSLYLYKAEIRLRVKKGSSPRHSRQVRLPGDPSKFSVRYEALLSRKHDSIM